MSRHGRACCIVAGRLLPEYGVLLGVPSAHAECMCPHRRWVTRFVPAGLSSPAKTQTMVVHSEPMAGGTNLVLPRRLHLRAGAQPHHVAGSTPWRATAGAHRPNRLWHKFWSSRRPGFDPNATAAGIVAIARACRADEHTTLRHHQTASAHRPPSAPGTLPLSGGSAPPYRRRSGGLHRRSCRPR